MKAPDAAAGKSGKCPKCRGAIAIPDPLDEPNVVDEPERPPDVSFRERVSSLSVPIIEQEVFPVGKRNVVDDARPRWKRRREGSSGDAPVGERETKVSALRITSQNSRRQMAGRCPPRAAGGIAGESWHFMKRDKIVLICGASMFGTGLIIMLAVLVIVLARRQVEAEPKAQAAAAVAKPAPIPQPVPIKPVAEIKPVPEPKAKVEPPKLKPIDPKLEIFRTRMLAFTEEAGSTARFIEKYEDSHHKLLVAKVARVSDLCSQIADPPTGFETAYFSAKGVRQSLSQICDKLTKARDDVLSSGQMPPARVVKGPAVKGSAAEAYILLRAQLAGVAADERRRAVEKAKIVIDECKVVAADLKLALIELERPLMKSMKR